MTKNTIINIPVLARVEGEGALKLEIRNERIVKMELSIYESPRFFEKFLEGRSYTEVLDFVARICGICPVAYQMSAVQAIENIFAITPSPWVREMRRLFYCGEWLESHNLHIHFLAAPDFLGYSSIFAMAKDYPNEVKRGLRLQALGNAIVKILGKRSVHPVGACVGGFFRAPTLEEMNALLEKIQQGLQDAEALVTWTASLPLPTNAHDFIYVSLSHPDEYPMNESRIVSNRGLDIAIDDFEHYFKETQVPYSTALQCTLQGKAYLVGPLARVNLNFDKLFAPIHSLIRKIGLLFPSNNMFHSIVARAIEVYYGVLEAKRILENYIYPQTPCVAVKPQAGIGYGCTEAPRGLLWHRYAINTQGLVEACTIVAPTSQNQARIEEDLRISLEKFGLNKSDEELRFYSEMLVRNYDPCISCSTHFLDLTVKRS